MRIVGFVCWIGVLLLAAAPEGVAQTSRIDSGMKAQARFSLYWDTRLSPAVPALGDAFGTRVLEVAPDRLQRVMLDRSRRVYFGYEVRVEPLDTPETFRLTLAPLTFSDELAGMLGADTAPWSALPEPLFPAPQTIRAGDVVAVPLLASTAWSQTLTDYITVASAERPRDTRGGREFVFPEGDPRDFALADVEVRLDRPHVRTTRMQGRTGSARHAEVAGDAAGALVWLYVPYQGRFVISLQPRPADGFVPAGEVRGTSLRFEAGGASYSVSSASRIAPGDGAYNVYVLHQPAWRPSYPHADVDAFAIGSADRAEYVVGAGLR